MNIAWENSCSDLQEKFSLADVVILSIQGGREVRILYKSSAKAPEEILSGHKLSDIILAKESAPLQGSSWAVPIHSATDADQWILFNQVAEPAYLVKQQSISTEISLFIDSLKTTLQIEEYENKVSILNNTLELQHVVSTSSSLSEARLAVCDYLKIFLKVETVVLGWISLNKIKDLSVDSGSKIEGNTELNRTYIRLMEESFDQRKEVIIPQIKNANYICSVHNELAADIGYDHILTIPVFFNEDILAVVTVGYYPSQKAEIEQLSNKASLLLNSTAELLYNKKYKERGLRNYALTWFHNKWSSVFGPRYILFKFLFIAFLLLIFISSLIPIDHKVTGDFSLKSKEQSLVVSSIQSKIQLHKLHVGDKVKKGEVVLILESSKEILEKDFLLNQITQFESRVREYRADGKLSEMYQFSSKIRESQIKLQSLEHRLSERLVKSPADGYIVEIYSEGKVNVPVDKGTPLFRVVSNKDFYVSMAVDERDIQYIKKGSSGEIAFTNNPDIKMKITLIEDEPIPAYQEASVKFMIKADLIDEQKTWFKDGMTGVSKIHAGRKSLLWVATRRSYLYLRMKLWF